MPAALSEDGMPSGICEFDAIWDTGATNCVITQACIDECGLAPTGMVQVHGVSGVIETETFLVDVWLPNYVRFNNVRVTRGKISGADILIGMDIISRGDFAVTNTNGLTKFSFRVPSLEHIDFTNTPPPTVGNRAARRRAKFGR